MSERWMLIPSLLESDCDYRMNGIKENAYRSDFNRYRSEKVLLKNAVLKNIPTDADVMPDLAALPGW